MAQLFNILVATLALACVLALAKAQSDDYGDNENYGNNNGGSGADNEGYGNFAGNNDDNGYSNYQPNQQSGVSSEGSDNNPSGSYSPQNQNDADGDYDNDDAAGAASSVQPTVVKRVRRSTLAESDKLKAQESVGAPKLRVKRWGKHSYIGPVYTYVKTDKHANFKWGVKHKVGKKHG